MELLCLIKHDWAKYGTWCKGPKARSTRWCRRCDTVQFSKVYYRGETGRIKWIRKNMSKLSDEELKAYDNW